MEEEEKTPLQRLQEWQRARWLPVTPHYMAYFDEVKQVERGRDARRAA